MPARRACGFRSVLSVATLVTGAWLGETARGHPSAGLLCLTDLAAPLAPLLVRCETCLAAAIETASCACWPYEYADRSSTVFVAQNWEVRMQPKYLGVAKPIVRRSAPTWLDRLMPLTFMTGSQTVNKAVAMHLQGRIVSPPP